MDILDKGRRRNSFQVKRLLDGGGEDSQKGITPKDNKSVRLKELIDQG